ncbi:copper chaperone CopZ [bacterium BMS3Abin07]|nr:copper chaperone CopZ [bacterium BMS3Abin07]GBE31493.1 copper chaperone CopZ [bacterium BMS3Bbin05]HDO23048.1 copper chaperone [Nitrospirota bacterium]HDZ88865.1 copper chaperone [Nitrospirota bacterium]
MSDVLFRIEGMSCQHCVMRVKKAIDSVDGVSSSDVEIGSAKVSFDDSKTSKDVIGNAINGSGYKVIV